MEQANDRVNGDDSGTCIPEGLCQCGCGGVTPIATSTNTRDRSVKGKPCRFMPKHSTRARYMQLLIGVEDPNPSGICMCGCGGQTAVATKSVPLSGYAIGHHRRYRPGHQAVKYTGALYIVTDCGYDTPCWIWRRGKQSDGYGSYTSADGKRGSLAHRVFYEERFGPIADGYELDHLCRRRDCVRPDHLEPVTHTRNIQRGAVAKINYAIAEEMRASDLDSKTLMERYGLSEAQVCNVLARRAWKQP